MHTNLPVDVFCFVCAAVVWLVGTQTFFFLSLGLRRRSGSWRSSCCWRRAGFSVSVSCKTSEQEGPPELQGMPRIFMSPGGASYLRVIG